MDTKRECFVVLLAVQGRFENDFGRRSLRTPCAHEAHIQAKPPVPNLTYRTHVRSQGDLPIPQHSPSHSFNGYEYTKKLAHLSYLPENVQELGNASCATLFPSS